MGLHRTRLLGTTAELLDAFMEDAARARRRIWVECFIVRADRLGTLLADTLADAARRGLDAQLLYDPMGCRATPAAFFTDLAARGVKVVAYGRNVHHYVGRVLPRARNHSRLYLLDDAGYTGGHAWGDEWLPADRGGIGWHDVCCRIEGPVVEEMAQLFERRCLEAVGTPTMIDYDTEDRYPDVRLISDAPAFTSVLYHAYLEAFSRARQRIWLANAYYFPPRDLIATLATAARRGIDVRLVLSGKSDIPLIRRAARAEYRDWLDAGIGIWEYETTVMHAKYALVDQTWSSVGTFNANAASLSVAIETALISCDLGFTASVVRQFETDLAASVRMQEAELARLPWRDRALDALAHGVMTCGDAILDPTTGHQAERRTSGVHPIRTSPRALSRGVANP
jgi:cardiolipin synthase A/B